MPIHLVVDLWNTSLRQAQEEAGYKSTYGSDTDSINRHTNSVKPMDSVKNTDSVKVTDSVKSTDCLKSTDSVKQLKPRVQHMPMHLVDVHRSRYSLHRFPNLQRHLKGSMVLDEIFQDISRTHTQYSTEILKLE